MSAHRLRKHLLIVDPDIESLTALEEALAEQYDIETCQTGEACLAFLADQPATDLILMETHLPDLDAHEACKHIRQSDHYIDLPIIFTTQQKHLKEILKSYEAGGDDNVMKPFDFDLLNAKIAAHLNHSHRTHNLQAELDDVTQAAINALIVTNELDVIVKFSNDSIAADSYPKLVQALFEALSSYHLSASVQIRSRFGARNYSMQGTLSPLENQIFKLHFQNDPIVHFSNKSVFSRDHVSILIKNMCTNEKNHYDRLVDHLTIITSYANARIKAIEIDEAKNIQSQQLSTQVVDLIKQDLHHLDQHFKGFEEHSKQVMEKLNQELDEILFSLALTDDQETLLQNIISSAHKDMDNILDQEIEMDHYIQSIGAHINSALEQESHDKQA